MRIQAQLIGVLCLVISVITLAVELIPELSCESERPRCPQAKASKEPPPIFLKNHATLAQGNANLYIEERGPGRQRRGGHLVMIAAGHRSEVRALGRPHSPARRENRLWMLEHERSATASQRGGSR